MPRLPAHRPLRMEGGRPSSPAPSPSPPALLLRLLPPDVNTHRGRAEGGQRHGNPGRKRKRGGQRPPFLGGSGRLPSGTSPLMLSIVCVVTVKPWWLVVAIKEKHRHVEFSFLCTALRQLSGTIIRVDRRVLLLANSLMQQMTVKQTTKRAITSSNDSWKWRIK